MIAPAELVTALLDAHNRRDSDALRAAYAPGATVHRAEGTTPIESDEWVAIREVMVTSFPDLTFRAGRIAAVGGAVMFEIRITGTNHGPLYLNDQDRLFLRTDAEALPPTGRAMVIDGVVVLEVSEGLIVAERHFLNQAATQQQLLLVDPASR